MITAIILLWILINMNAPTWTYVLLGIGFTIQMIKFGIDCANQ